MTGWGDQKTPTLAWHCADCTKPTTFAIEASWWVQATDDEDPFEPFQYEVGRCMTCGTAYLWVIETDGFEEGQRRQEYPTPIRRLSEAVPIPLRETYAESRRCMSVAAYTAVVVLVRRLVEGICQDNGGNGRTLAAKLKSLNESGKLDERLYKWSTLLKDLGNEGAHEIFAAPSRQDAEEALLFIEALLDYLYTFQARYDAFMTRRGTAKSTA